MSHSSAVNAPQKQTAEMTEKIIVQPIPAFYRGATRAGKRRPECLETATGAAIQGAIAGTHHSI
jgi:hypothetical protein